MAQQLVSVVRAIQHIGAGKKFSEIQDRLDINLDDSASRQLWIDVLNGAYMFGLATNAKHTSKLCPLIEHVDQLIERHWEAKEQTFQFSHSVEA